MLKNLLKNIFTYKNVLQSFPQPLRAGWNEILILKEKLKSQTLYISSPLTGQHNDARMNLAITISAARYGAAVANYTEVVELLKTRDPQTGKEKVCGARCRDVITGKTKGHIPSQGNTHTHSGDYLNISDPPLPFAGREFDVKAKCVINATGPFTDTLRKMDNQETVKICQPSAGVHIVIPGYYRCRIQSAHSFFSLICINLHIFILMVFSHSCV